MLGTWSALLFGISITWKSLTWFLGILMRMYANHDAPGANKGAAYGWEILMPSWTQVRKARERRRKVKEEAATVTVLNHLGLPTRGPSPTPKENFYTTPRDQHLRLYAGTDSLLAQLHDPASARYPEIKQQLLRAKAEDNLFPRDRDINQKRPDTPETLQDVGDCLRSFGDEFNQASHEFYGSRTVPRRGQLPPPPRLPRTNTLPRPRRDDPGDDPPPTTGQL
jgi:hypothetical protein